MSSALRAKIEVVLETLNNTESEYSSYEELEEKVRVSEDLSELEKFKVVLGIVCKHCINTKDKNWVAKLYGGGSDISFIAEMIIAYYNQNCHTYSSSPFFTFAEEQILKKVIGYVGYDSGASGIFLPGGSYCTLIAMICARHTRYPNSKKEGIREAMQVVTSTNSHYSIPKSCIMMGMGTDSVIEIDFNTTTTAEFEEIVLSNNVIMLNSTFGTTSEGFMENIDKFSQVMKQHGIWHHIDACVGGIALFSDKYRYLTDSFKHADSITIDAHKCLNLNQQCSMLLVRHGQVLSDSSRTHAPYLFHQDAEYDIANRSFQCGRRADGFKLWLCDQLDDLNAQATLMYDRNIEMKQIIAQDDRFIQVLGDSMTHTCFQLNTDKPVDIHRIVAHMRKENMFLEYHSDYFRLVLVNKEIVAEDFLKILERVIEVQAEFCS